MSAALSLQTLVQIILMKGPIYLSLEQSLIELFGSSPLDRYCLRPCIVQGMEVKSFSFETVTGVGHG